MAEQPAEVETVEVDRQAEHETQSPVHLKRSLRLRRMVGDLEGEIGVLYDLAKIYEKLEDPDKVRGARDEAMSKKAQLEEAQEAYPVAERRS